MLCTRVRQVNHRDVLNRLQEFKIRLNGLHTAHTVTTKGHIIVRDQRTKDKRNKAENVSRKGGGGGGSFRFEVRRLHCGIPDDSSTQFGDSPYVSMIRLHVSAISLHVFGDPPTFGDFPTRAKF